MRLKKDASSTRNTRGTAAFVQEAWHKGTDAMTEAAGDRPFDWVAALAVISGGAVMIPSLLALAATLLGVAAALL
jgi:hypothetical protein